MASNKPTAVHFSLIFFVMFSIIMTVMFYINFRELNAREAAFAKAEADLKTESEAVRNRDDDIQELSKLIGHEGLEEVGIDDRENPSTLMGAMLADMRTYGGNVAQQSYSATIRQLRAELDNVTREREQLTSDLDKVKTDLLALRGIHNQRVQQYDDVRTKAETDLSGLVKNKQEEISQKDSAIADLQNRASTLTIELQQERDSAAKFAKEATEDIAQLTRINDALQTKLDDERNYSFEVEDGVVRWVDNLSRTVWVNLGSADNLNKRTTFSVYRKGHSGVGRGPEDIKGSIEITNVISAHLSEARILDDDLYQPMSPGDPIYTPMWSPGRKENFSFVGKIDLDNDGSYDRDLLHQLVKSAGASIDNEVLDNGERIGDGIDVNTKFLVVAEVPEPDNSLSAEEQDIVNKMQKHRKDMIEEARRQAVRVVNLTDFLSFIGYRPQRRLFIPGVADRPFNLKSGTRQTVTNEGIGNRSSSGQVSGAFSGNKRLKQQNQSSGQTSKLFGGGY